MMRIRSFRLFLLALRFSPLLLFTSVATADFLYVANGAASTVGVYAINPTTGALTFVENEPTGLGPTSVAIDPTGQFAYVAIGTNGTVSVHTINPTTGALTQVENELTGLNPRSVAVDPTGKFAYVANYSSSTVGVYTINPTTGALTQVENELTGQGPVSISISVALSAPSLPLSIRVPTTSTGTHTISWGAATGTVTRYELQQATNSGFTAPVTTNNGTALSRSVTVTQNGTYYYRVRACNTSGCSGYRNGGNGVVVTAPVLTPGIPSSIAVPFNAMAPKTSPNPSSVDYPISWGSSSGIVTHYELQEGEGDFNFRTCGFSAPRLAYSGPSLTTTIIGKVPLSYYCYRVRACNNTVCSSYRTGENSVIVDRIMRRF